MSARIFETIVDNESPSFYREFAELAGKVKFRVEKAVMICAAMVWAKETLANGGRGRDQLNLEKMIFHSIGDAVCCRTLSMLLENFELKRASVSVRELNYHKFGGVYGRILAEDRILFLIRQALTLLEQPSVLEAIEAVGKAFLDSHILSGEELSKDLFCIPRI